MVTLPYLLAIQVREQLNDKSSENNFDASQNSFLETDFRRVTKINYTGDALDPRIFTNLTSITFDYKPQVDTSIINEILKNFPNIEELRIRNQSTIQLLDLSRLSKLKKLEITSNKNLIKVIGFNSGLSNIKFYDNPLYRESSDLCKYVFKNLEHGLSASIDALYYPEMYRVINSFDGDKQELYDLLALYVKWIEKLTEERKTDFDDVSDEIPNDHTITYKTLQMNLIHQRASSLVSTLLKNEDSEEEKLIILYLWLCKNVRYEEPKKKEEPTGTFSSLLSGKSSYKGYTKTLEYILKLAGFKVYEVPCTFINPNPEEIKNKLNYFILKISIDGKVYYFDPRLDASRFQDGKNKYLPRFMISIEDVLRNYKTINESGSFSGDSISFKDKIKLIEYAERRLSELSNDNYKNFTL